MFFDKPFATCACHCPSPKHDQVRDAIAQIRIEFSPSPEHEVDDSPVVDGDEKRNNGAGAADDADGKEKVCQHLKPRMPT